MQIIKYPLIILLLVIVKAQAQKVDSTAKTLDEVVVTGQFTPQSIRNSVYQVRIIDSKRIEQRAATNIAGILNNELGIRFTNDMALGTSNIQLMGMSGRNVKILLDGIPMADRGDTRESLNQIDINSIERIEIVEGPLSVSYGTDALAGVINIITKKQTDKKWSIYAKTQEETAGNEYNALTKQGVHNQSIGGTFQTGKWHIGGGVSSNNFGGWQGNSLARSKQWLPKDQLLGNVKFGFENSKSSIYYRLDALNENILSEGNANVNTNQARDQKYITNRLMHQIQGEWKINDIFSLNSFVSYTDYDRRTQTSIIDLNTNKRTLSLGAGEQDIAIITSKNSKTTFQAKLSEKISIQTGFDINIDQASGARINGEPVISDYALFVTSAFNPTTRIQIRPGLRFIKNSVYDAPPVIPSINTKIKLTKSVDFRAAYAHGYRSPALRELYFNFFDASHSIQGNPNLKAEFSDSFNGSFAWQNTKTDAKLVKSTLGLFYNTFTNLISTAADPNNPAVTTYINIENYKTTGFTFENSIRLKNLTGNIGASYIGQLNEIKEDEKITDNQITTYLWSPEVNANLIYSFTKSGTDLGFFYKYTGKRPSYITSTATDGSVTASPVSIDGFHWADFTVSQKITKQLKVSAGVKNIPNVTQLRNSGVVGNTAHSGNGPVATSYGRSYFLNLNYNISQ
jgi:outer membrane receptor for ferrienterochelin and colicins